MSSYPPLSLSLCTILFSRLLLHCMNRCLTWAEGNIVEEMLADVCDPSTGRCHGNVVKVRYNLILITFIRSFWTVNNCRQALEEGEN